ncbi:MAG: Ig-like domain-containing protein, partial [Candidatus Micrarchaeota archaeon]
MTNSTLIGWCSATDDNSELLSYDVKWFKNSVLYSQPISEYITTGQAHSCGILTNGSAYCWGQGSSGQIGYGGIVQQLLPKAVNISATFKTITGGYYSVCGILTNNSAYCWGNSGQGQLGYGGTTNQYNPIAVNISSTFQALSGGYFHTCGILIDGTAYCWGLGSDGRLGYGGTTQQNNPIIVNISSTFKMISAGSSHTCGILTNGSAYCWGLGSSGRLGYGGTTSQKNPKAVNMSSTFKIISADYIHSCGILINGTAYCWGNGTYGQLGYGGVDNQNNPKAVNISSTFKTISTGGYHSCGILTNGSAYCWGNGSKGQLGYGGIVDQYNPIAVNISATFKTISVDYFHTCGVLTNGTAYCWGLNANGQLGDNSTTQQNNPRAVIASSTMWPQFSQGSLANIANITHGLTVYDNWTLECTASNDTIYSSALNSSIITITDITAPSISIEYPTNGLNLSTNVSITLNFTAIDPESGLNTSTCTYSLDAGAGVAIPSCNNGTFDTSEGSHSITVSAADNLGNTGTSSSISFTVDLTVPSLTIESPINNTNYSVDSVDLNFTAIERLTDLDKCWYSLDGGANTTLVGCANTTITPGEARHNILFYANDTVNNVNTSSNLTFTIDLTAPSLTVESPINNSNYSVDSVDLNFTVMDTLTGIDKCWYSLDGGANTTLVGCANTTITPGEARHTILFYTNDSANNVNTSSNLTFTID